LHLLSYCYRGELYGWQQRNVCNIISYVEWGSARDLVIHTYSVWLLLTVRNAMDDRDFWVPFIGGIFDHFGHDRIDLASWRAILGPLQTSAGILVIGIPSF